MVLDYSKENYHLQPENVVVINQFDGEKNDDALSHASNLLKCKRMSEENLSLNLIRLGEFLTF